VKECPWRAAISARANFKSGGRKLATWLTVSGWMELIGMILPTSSLSLAGLAGTFRGRFLGPAVGRL
jgi:hypothetical protein